MPTYKISQLTTATAVSATNQFEINQNGTSKRVEVSVIDAYIKSTSNLPVVVSVSSATDAVRITQTGAGNALVVEDSANPDATPFVVDASGQLTVGASVRSTIGTVTPNILVQNNSSGTANGIGVASWLASTAGSKVALGKSRSTTIGTNSIVLSGDALATISFAGDDGAAFIDAASITAAVDGTPGLNNMPGRLVFSTTANGASTPTERMRIDNAGAVGIGTTSPDATRALTLNRTGNYGGIEFRVNNSTMARIQQESTGNLFIDSGIAVTSGSTIFRTANNNERMRIDNAGNVGIGTTSPGSNLDVKGTLRLSGSTSGYVGLAPAAAAGSTTYTLPAADGTNGQVLSTNGSGTLSWASATATGTLKNVQVFTSSGTYTRTAGVTAAVVIAVGGGGGGAGVSGSTGNAGSGGTTSFGSHVSAAGGTGATSSAISSSWLPGAGGSGGTGSTIAIRGAPGSFPTADGSGAGGGEGGGRGVRGNTSGVAGVRGGGGSGANGATIEAGGGQGETAIKYTTTVGSTETVTIGAGGSAGGGTQAGGAGGAGYIIVYEYS